MRMLQTACMASSESRIAFAHLSADNEIQRLFHVSDGQEVPRSEWPKYELKPLWGVLRTC